MNRWLGSINHVSITVSDLGTSHALLRAGIHALPGS